MMVSKIIRLGLAGHVRLAGLVGLALLLSGCSLLRAEPCEEHLGALERLVPGQGELDGENAHAFAYQECRAGLGDKLAMLWLGQQFERGSTLVEVDMKKAFGLYKKAAIDEALQTSVFVPGAKGEPGSTMTLDNEGATPGLPEAQYRLGLMYAEGRGTDQSTKLAWESVHQAARAGHKPAVVWLHEYELHRQEEQKKAREQADI